MKGDDVMESELTVVIRRKSDIIGGWELHTVLLKRSCALGLADLQKLEYLFIQIKNERREIKFRPGRRASHDLLIGHAT